MASILRRTLSPAHRGDPAAAFSPHPPQRPSPLSSSSSSSYSIPAPYSSSCFLGALRRLLPRAILLLSRPRRKSGRPWKATLLRLLLFFVCGLLLGFFPFAHVGDDVSMTPRDLAFGTASSSLSAISRDATTVTSVRALETVKREEIVAVELEAKKDAGIGGPEELVAPSNLLIVVTPTYNRAMQAYYLTRLGQTLKLVHPPLLWIVSETGSASIETAQLLRESGVMYRHIVSNKNSTDVKDRGVHQRNAALEHIQHHKMDGIVYFADDDNIYSLELFEQMRKIRRFGTWPVAMLAQSKSKAALEGPVCGGSDVVGWHTNEKSKRLRRFHVDMSGFAFNSTILWDPKRWHPSASNIIRQLDTVKEGFQETTFIEQLVEDESQMEAIPSGCSKIMNWHLHLDAHGLSYPKGWRLPKNLQVVIPLQELQNLNGFLHR